MSLLIDALRRKAELDEMGASPTAPPDARIAAAAPGHTEPPERPRRAGPGLVAIVVTLVAAGGLTMVVCSPQVGGRETASAAKPAPAVQPLPSAQPPVSPEPVPEVPPALERSSVPSAGRVPPARAESRRERIVRPTPGAVAAVPSARDSVPLPPSPAISAPGATAPPVPDHFRLALEYQRAGNLPSAIVEYRALLADNEASAEAHNNLGALYQEQGETAAARAEFERAIAIDPAYEKAHNNLGVSLMSDGRERAASEFRSALAIDSRRVEPLVNLALVEYAAGRGEQAVALLGRAVEIDPRHAGAHYNLGMVADKRGDVATAVEHYRAFLKFGAVKYGDLAGRVRARLSALGG